ncbi:putative cell survival pathways protein [Vanrija albida]|uniref:Cell survival pathways protein n=1 Tax=Vanrija albida TaxID=181172 RepID=A0ABR3Q9R3_9TREE
MSWFGGGSHHDKTPNFFPVTAYNSGYGALTDTDTAWECISNKGFQTETQTYYSVLEDGSIVMIQIIWSFLGLFLVPATTQMTFKLYNPTTKKTVWKSVNVKDFKTDGRSSKSDAFEIKHTGTSAGEEVYELNANLDKTVQLNVKWTRPASAPGCKYGEGEGGGYSTFGRDRSVEKRDGFIVHRFHPFAVTSGTFVVDGTLVDAKGDGMFVHAIQGGMRPNLTASRWNFTFFTTGGGYEESEIGAVRAVFMEFLTTDDYGPGGKNSERAKVSVGTIYASGLPNSRLAMVGQSHPATEAWPVPNKDHVDAKHLNPVKDKDTGYLAPTGYEFIWAGDRSDKEGKFEANLTVDDLNAGLVEKVDVLAEIPYVLRKALAAATGTKPFIFQWHNPATLNIDLGDKKLAVKGWSYAEASYISQ